MQEYHSLKEKERSTIVITCRDVDCGVENSDSASFCIDCGLPLKALAVNVNEAVTETPNADSPPGQSPAVESNMLSVEEVGEELPTPLPETPTQQTLEPLRLQTYHELALHIGLEKDEMEDACIAETVLYPARNPEFSVTVLVGADGIGGSGEAGEVFAQTAVHAIWMGLRRTLPYSERFMKFLDTASRDQCWEMLCKSLHAPDPSRDPLLAQVFWANNCIRSFARGLFTPQQFEAGGFGCTVAVAVVICDLKNGRAVIHGYNEGDAPIFLLLDGQVTTLSTEHVEEIVHDDQKKTVLSRWLGRCDTPGGTRFERQLDLSPEFHAGQVVICSDGLANMLSPEQIAETCKQLTNIPGVCQALVNQALSVDQPHNPNQTTGDDNILVAMASFSKGEQGDFSS